MRSEGLQAPKVTADEAQRFLEESFGWSAQVSDLGSQQDRNLLVSGSDGRPLGVLRFANPAFAAHEIDAQDAAADLLAAAEADLRVATVLRLPADRPMRGELQSRSGLVVGRVLRHLPGGTLSGPAHLPPPVVSAMGDIAGRASRALRDQRHPGLDRFVQWDPRHCALVVGALLRYVPDASRRFRLEEAARIAASHLEPLTSQLTEQAVHLDLTDDNLVWGHRATGPKVPDGVIDFGDLSTSWAINELAVTVTSILHHAGNEPHTVLPAIQAFEALRPISDAETEALWAIVVLRAVILVVSGSHQSHIEPGNVYAADGLAREWAIFEQAMSVPITVMAALVDDALHPQMRRSSPGGGSPVDRSGSLLVAPLQLQRITSLRLDSESDDLDGGRWLDEGIEADLAAVALQSFCAVHTRYGEARLTRSTVASPVSPSSVATGIEAWFALPQQLVAPWDAVLSSPKANCLELVNGESRLVLEWESAAVGDDARSGTTADVSPDATGEGVTHGDATGPVRAGSSIAVVGAGQRLTVCLRAASAPEIDLLVRPEYAAGYLYHCPDPASLLGLGASPGRARSDELLVRRNLALAEVQEHYFATPPQIERGWRHHLISADGRVYLDMVNNVAVLGHSHPRISEAIVRQSRRLNTNSRFHYRALVELSERLVATVPDPLDTVFLVNSGSEANDLALRLAFAASGRRDVVALREAYHGWTIATDAVSTSVADNPHATSTRPDWVHTVDAPNSYRGRHRGVEALRYGPEAAATIDALAAVGRPAAAWISEPVSGNAGGMVLPAGYLSQVYAAVRRHGGLAIADEVQVGYGRLGRWFWGFEQQGCVPDIVTVAKAMGNGHPLGAVITTAEIAARFSSEGYFFSSTGGSPIASVIGATVLDVLAEEALPVNAAVVGDHLKARLEELSGTHDLIGAVHGTGLYLGVELVVDRTSLEPATAATTLVCERLLDLGVVMQPTGDRMCVLKIKPPLCIDRAGADFFVDSLDRVLSEM